MTNPNAIDPSANLPLCPEEEDGSDALEGNATPVAYPLPNANCRRTADALVQKRAYHHKKPNTEDPSAHLPLCPEEEDGSDALEGGAEPIVYPLPNANCRKTTDALVQKRAHHHKKPNTEDPSAHLPVCPEEEDGSDALPEGVAIVAYPLPNATCRRTDESLVQKRAHHHHHTNPNAIDPSEHLPLCPEEEDGSDALEGNATPVAYPLPGANCRRTADALT